MFLYRETEAQRGSEVGQKPHSRPMEELRTEPRFPDTSTNDSTITTVRAEQEGAKRQKINFF